MPIQQVSFQNASTVKQNQQQNVAVNSVVKSSTGDTVELSGRTKENKVLKYSLIGVGALLGIVALVKHKSIAKIFKKASDVEHDIKPLPQDSSKTIDNAIQPSVSNNSQSGSRIKTSSPEAEINSIQSVKPSNQNEASISQDVSSETTEYITVNQQENKPIKIPLYREEGDSRLLFKNLTAEENKSLSSFLSKKQFTKNDYDNLSEIEKNVLRALVDRSFQKEPSKFFQIERPVRSIAKDLDFMTKVTDKVEESLKLKYPKGFTVISLGGSPSLINDLLVARGYKTKSIPFSTAFFEKEEAKTFNFEKYLNKFGITKENSKNTNFVYLDYVQMGHTKEAFEKLMKTNGFNYKFESMDDLYKTLSPEDSKFMKDYFLQGSNIKAYVTCPKLTEVSQHNQVEEVLKDYEWGSPAKLMHFAILDKTCTTKTKPIQINVVGSSSKISSQKTKNAAPLVSRIKKLSDMEVRSLVSKSLDAEHKYKLSDSERAIIQNKYGEYSQKYIENLCRPIGEDSFQFMTKFVNVCDGKYAEYWRSNPDKLVLITNTGSLHNKIDKNLSEPEWDIIINSFKTLFDGEADAKTIEAVVKYKGTDFDNVNGTIIHQNRLDKILKSLDNKESLSSQELQKIKLKLNYLRDILDSQLFINELSFKESHIAIFEEFNKICNSLNKDTFNVNDINKFKNRLLNYKNSIINLGTEKNIQDKTRLITELIGNNGEVLDGVKLNRVERSLNGSILSTVEVDGQPLSELMAKAKTDENTRNKISSYLNNNQPILERDSFMSTSLPVVNAFHDNDVYWKLTPQKGVKGLYIEDAYDILRERKDGREAEVLIQRGSKVHVKKAEFKDGVWHLEGIITPADK